MTWTPDRVTVSEAADRLGKTPQAMSRHLKRYGHKPGIDGKYDFAQVQKTAAEGEAMDRNAGGADRVGASIRKLKAEAELIELKLAERRGELVGKSEVGETLDRLAVLIRGELMSIDEGQRCEGQTAARITAIYREAHHKVLRHLSALIGKGCEERFAKKEIDGVRWLCLRLDNPKGE